MPRTITEDEDPMPLTDLLRTGEASRLRRRGAMHRSGHRREDSDDLSIPPHRRPMVEPAGQSQPQDLYVELHCGVHTRESSFSASSSSSSPLPRTKPTRPSSPVGFTFASTGCGAQVSARASPRQLGSSSVHQVYSSTEVCPDVASLPHKYLDRVQRAVAEFVAREGCACQCEWEPIGCIVCGNPLGLLFVPCHARHSLDHSPPCATYVFFPPSVTPSPTHSFPKIDPSRSGNLPPLVSLSEPDDMSVDSPISSPRAPMTSAWYSSPNAQSQPSWVPDQNDAFSWGSWNPNPALIPTAPSSPTELSRADASSGWNLDPASMPSAPASPARLVPTSSSALTERPADHSRPNSWHEPPSVQPPVGGLEDPPPFHVISRFSEPQEPSTFIHPSPHMARSAASGPNREVVSDDDWSIYLLGRDRAPSSARRPRESHANNISRDVFHPWVPREQRERPPGALTSGERVLDRPVAMTRPQPSEGSTPHLHVGSGAPARTVEHPTLHRIPRRSLTALTPPIRRPASLDASSWRQYGGTLSRLSGAVPPPRTTTELQEQPRMSRRSATPISSTRPSRRLTVPAQDPTPTAASAPLDSTGGHRHLSGSPPTPDTHDHPGDESEANVFRFSRFLDENALVDAITIDPELRRAGPSSTDVVGAESTANDEEKQDEDKPEGEGRAGDLSGRSAPEVRHTPGGDTAS